MQHTYLDTHWTFPLCLLWPRFSGLLGHDTIRNAQLWRTKQAYNTGFLTNVAAHREFCGQLLSLLSVECVADWVELVSKQVAESLGGKGGGRSGRYQGKAAEITQAQVEEAIQKMSASTTSAQRP